MKLVTILGTSSEPRDETSWTIPLQSKVRDKQEAPSDIVGRPMAVRRSDPIRMLYAAHVRIEPAAVSSWAAQMAAGSYAQTLCVKQNHLQHDERGRV